MDKIKELQEKAGWNDETLLSLLLTFLEDSGTADTAYHRLREIATDEANA